VSGLGEFRGRLTYFSPELSMTSPDSKETTINADRSGPAVLIPLAQEKIAARSLPRSPVLRAGSEWSRMGSQ
jgi:hypothetical protein